MTRVITADQVDVVLDADADVGEGPVWDVSTEELLWVDIPRHLLHRLHPASGRCRTRDVGQPLGAVAVRDAGGVVLAVRDGFALVDADGDAVELVGEVEKPLTGNRMNDGKCDTSGRFWAGTMATDMTPGAGALYRLDCDQTVTKVVDATSVANGLAWALDDRTMYFVDSGVGGVDAFDYTPGSGSVTNRRRIIDVAPQDGLPDGMTIDAEGLLWIALWDGWGVRRYTPDGILDTVIEVPTAQITSCTFGGTDLNELYITSAAAGLSDRQRATQPHAGAVFRARPGIPGLPPQRFGG